MKESAKSSKKSILAITVALVLFGAGVYLSYFWITHKPKGHKRSTIKESAPLVEVIAPVPRTIEAEVHAFGEVNAYRTQSLSARVSSKITWISDSLIPGFVVKKGEPLIRLDDSDFLLDLPQKEYALNEAKLQLETELQKSASAAYELSLSKLDLTADEKEYLLRKPHIKAAKSAVKAAEAALQRVKLDLERCQIVAPFDAIVQNVEAAVGDQVKEASMLATLIETDRFLIKATLSTRDLFTIKIPGYNSVDGSLAKIRHDFWRSETESLEGRVLSLEASLDPQSKTANLLIEVKDPLSLNGTHKPLVLNGFVKVAIKGRVFENVVSIPADIFRGDSTLWCVGEDKRLRIKRVKTLWRSKNGYLVPFSEFDPDEKILLTGLDIPIEGMKLRVKVLETPNAVGR